MYSLAVTAFQEMSKGRRYGGGILKTIAPAQEHPAISEIIIIDDASEDFDDLAVILQDQPKVLLYHNETNRGVFGNKLEAIAQATNDWVITCDSDNVMDAAYLNRITQEKLSPDTWYCASFAKPKFDYRQLVGKYNLASLSKVQRHKIFRCFFNTGNQTVHRSSFMQVFEKYRNQRADLILPNYLSLQRTERDTHYWRLVFDALDSFVFNHQWILTGNNLNIMSGLEYDHHYTTGDEGNYIRSPEEKNRLGQILYALLTTQISGANND